MPHPDGWAKDSVTRTAMGGKTIMPKKTTIVESTRKKKTTEAPVSACDHLLVYYGNYEGKPLGKIRTQVPSANHWANLLLPYCPRCGGELKV